jgi:hypothetical protein
MTDPVQLLIDAGAIPSTPFVPQSRYSGVPLAVWQRRPEERVLAYVQRRFIPAAASLTIVARHVAAALDRPDLLGARYLGDPLLYWHIADANAVVDPNELTDTVGRRVEIPLAPGM